VDQIEGALTSLLGKFYVEAKVGYYHDFPKEGIIFKDLSFALADPDCLKTIVSFKI
jgi:adenine/guanine phosphoribosyltransferase-like PRPP-binding protein